MLVFKVVPFLEAVEHLCCSACSFLELLQLLLSNHIALTMIIDTVCDWVALWHSFPVPQRA